MEWIAAMQQAITYMEEHLMEEINYEKIAYENLKDNPIFQQLPEVAKQARIKNEINKIKILGLYS